MEEKKVDTTNDQPKTEWDRLWEAISKVFYSIKILII